MNNEFTQFSLSDTMIETLTLLEYVQPTPIQSAVIPLILEGRPVIAKSQTGTGKTAAFAIPLCELVSWEENQPQALVLEPTRELSVQVRDELFRIGRKKRLKVPAVFGGFPIDKQMRTLKQKSHLVVGTPGRIMDLIGRESLKLDKVRYLVIDEADLMFDMGFFDDVKRLLELLPEDVQLLLFSATIGPRVQVLTQEYMPDAVAVILEAQTEDAGTVTELIYETEPDHKYHEFITILMHENPDSSMIFCGTREMVNVLYQKMKRDRISCGMIHGEMEQKERLAMIDSFRAGKFRFLIATDVAARGIDIENISHVINYDFPTGRETYVHRIGRTGRNGKNGTAVSLVTDTEMRMKQMVEEYLDRLLPALPCPERRPELSAQFTQKQKTRQVLVKRKGEALNQGILRLSIGGGKKSKLRAVDLVGGICGIEGIVAEDIGIIDIRESLSYVEILNGKGRLVLEALQTRPIKGKIRKVRVTRNPV